MEDSSIAKLFKTKFLSQIWHAREICHSVDMFRLGAVASWSLKFPLLDSTLKALAFTTWTPPVLCRASIRSYANAMNDRKFLILLWGYVNRGSSCPGMFPWSTAPA